MTKICKYFFILFCITTFSGKAATIVSGVVSGQWTITGSPYLVINHLTIPSDSTLIIEAGVSVLFQGNYKVKIDGRVLAIGTSTDSILFDTTNTANGFGGIRFEATNALQDSSVFEYCKILHASVGAPGNTGFDNYGGAFLLNNFSKVRIQYCLITFNRAYAGAGIACYDGSSPLILDNEISFNQAGNATSTIDQGGGIFCISGSSAIIRGNNINNNLAVLSGSAIYASNCNLIVEDNIITFNRYFPLQILNGTVSLTGNDITYNNLSSAPGPAVSIGGNCIAIIHNNNISNNYNYGGVSGNGSPKGGGIRIGTTARATITNNIINYNHVMLAAGTAICEGGGIHSSADTSIFIANNFICNNYVTLDAFGAGVYINKGILINNVICNNQGIGGSSFGRGGGVFALDTVTFINNTIANNYASRGGGICFVGGNNVTIRNCIIYGNDVTSSGFGRQLYCFNGSNTTNNFNIYNCNIDSGFARIAHSVNPLLGTVYQDNIDTIPAFVNPSAGAGYLFDGTIANWSLMPSSQCINTGDTTGVTATTDIAGNARVVDVSIDMGAYEYQSIITNLTKLDNIKTFNVYPNPANEILNVRVDFMEQDFKFSIIDLMSKEVISETMSIKHSSLNIKNLASGIYFVKIGDEVRKFVKE